MTRLLVPLDQNPYPVDIAPGLIDRFGERLSRRTRARQFLVIADERVMKLHGPRLLRALRPHGSVTVATVRPGEKSKTLASAERLYRSCHDASLGRDGAIVAFGGGMVGDLAGFVAATWQRGVDLVMVPTTLLAQVDSAVGGKVAVNVAGIKNSVGAFHQPRLVVSDVTLLSTLPRRELRSGLAEVVKYGMIADRPLFERLERRVDRLLEADPAELAWIVTRCCRIKSDIVARDERDRGVRLLLNYGHTIGHALEAAAPGALRHGEAVALGMRGAARIATEIGWLGEEPRRRQDDLLDRIALPRGFSGATPRVLLSKIMRDKKVRDRKPRFVLTRGIGSARVAPPIDSPLLRRVLATLTGSQV